MIISLIFFFFCKFIKSIQYNAIHNILMQNQILLAKEQLQIDVDTP